MRARRAEPRGSCDCFLAQSQIRKGTKGLHTRPCVRAPLKLFSFTLSASMQVAWGLLPHPSCGHSGKGGAPFYIHLSMPSTDTPSHLPLLSSCRGWIEGHGCLHKGNLGTLTRVTWRGRPRRRWRDHDINVQDLLWEAGDRKCSWLAVLPRIWGS